MRLSTQAVELVCVAACSSLFGIGWSWDEEVGRGREMNWSSLLVAAVKAVPYISSVQARVLLSVGVLTESRGCSTHASYRVLELKMY